jgi:S-adenosylmethionine decarboxylase
MKDTNKKSFGLHLMFDAYDCDPKVLDDANRLYDLLDSLPPHLKMRPMIKPYIVRTPGNGTHDPGGWSGFVLIEESHISFHTFVRRHFVTVDIYTCKSFDTDLAIKLLKKFFKTDKVETIVEVRGKKYPSENIS